MGVLLAKVSCFPYRFIGPFLETVNKWERALANISEIIEEWLLVQRKWLYLEGIFIGGDIRTQLPEEARKFDDIDKAYRRVGNILFTYAGCFALLLVSTQFI